MAVTVTGELTDWRITSLPCCSGLLLPCVELVLDDLEDLLLVGRLLLPGSAITGGTTAAGGT